MPSKKSSKTANTVPNDNAAGKNNWKVVRFEIGEHRKGIELVTRFRKEFASAAHPTDAAVFLDYDANHARRYYFSPDAVRIFGPVLESLGATDSEAPVPEATFFLAGGEGAAASGPWKMDQAQISDRQ